MKGLLGLVAIAGTILLPMRAQQGQTKKAPALPDFDIRREHSRLASAKSLFQERSVLSPPAQQDPEQVAKSFLLDNRAAFSLAPADLQNLRVTRKDVSSELTILDLHQTLNGIPVFQGLVKVVIDRVGQVVKASAGDVVPQLSLSTMPRLSAEQAVRAAYQSIGRDVPARLDRVDGTSAFRNPRGPDYTDIAVELSIFPLTAASARLAYRVYLDADESHWFEILVAANDGRPLFRRNLYVDAAQGRVWRESPQKSGRQLLPFGDTWLPPDASITTGNNADAFLDRNGDNAPDAATLPNTYNGRALSSSQVFDFPAAEGTTGQDPRNFAASAVTNLFYLVNSAHDYYYSLGFNEAAGNFQADNFGRGGAGNDPVRAHAQFGGFTNNASFAPAPDGISPRLRMGLFTRGTSTLTDDLDSAYDGQVVFHEYGHGVSTRLVGARTETSCLYGVQSGAMAEGWSDYFSCSFYNDPVQGAYLTQDPVRGVRRQSYEGYPFTYEDLGNEGFEVHRDGEIWAATLWDLRKTLGQEVVDRLVFNGLKATPCRPTMIDARDAILTADQTVNSGANRLRIWAVFARHGMGFSAGGVESGDAVVYDAAFDLPPDLQPGNRSPRIASRPPARAALSSLYQYQVQATDPDGGQPRYELTQGPAGMIVDAATGLIRWNPTFTGARVKVTVTDGQGGRVVHGFFLRVETPLSPGTPVPIAGPRGSMGLATIDVPQGAPALQVTLRGGAGDADLGLIGPDGNFYGYSLRLQSNETLSVASPRPGRWSIRVAELGSGDYSGVTLTAFLPEPMVLPANSIQESLSGEESSETFFRVRLPAGVSMLHVTTSGGTGDSDVYVRRALVPVCQLSELVSAPCVFDQRSTGPTTAETVDVANPAAGDWYITIAGYSAYSGVALNISITGAPALLVSLPSLVFAATEGAAAPPPQTITISNAARAPFTWTAQVRTTSGGNWLGLAQAGGNAEATVPVSVNLAGLTAGTYTGSIMLTSRDLPGSPQTVAVTLSVTARPVISAPVSALSFAAVEGVDPAPQAINVSVSGGVRLTTAATTASGGNWLLISPTSAAESLPLQVSVRSAALALGNYSGAITITAAGASNSPLVIRVTLSVGLPIVVSGTGVVNAASFAQNRPVAPNEIISLFGSNFTAPCSMTPSGADACPSARGFPLPTELASVRVTFDGTPAPLLLVTPQQINLIVPFGVIGPTATVVVTRGSLAGPPVTVPLASQAPGIFTALGAGAGAGVILHADGRLVSRASPIEPDEMLVVYTTGLGAVTPALPAGAPAPASPLSEVAMPVRVLFDGEEGRVVFAGPTPGFAGLYQVNVVTPAVVARRFPLVRVLSAVSSSNEVSAGGPSILDITPGSAGGDITVTIRGINFAADSALRVGAETIPATLIDGPLQALIATIPATLAAADGVSIAVVDTAAPEEAPSNSVRLVAPVRE